MILVAFSWRCILSWREEVLYYINLIRQQKIKSSWSNHQKHTRHDREATQQKMLKQNHVWQTQTTVPNCPQKQWLQKRNWIQIKRRGWNTQTKKERTPPETWDLLVQPPLQSKSKNTNWQRISENPGEKLSMRNKVAQIFQPPHSNTLFLMHPQYWLHHQCPQPETHENRNRRTRMQL